MTNKPCAELHLTPASGAVGDLVGVTGWAPITQNISLETNSGGQADYNYQLDLDGPPRTAQQDVTVHVVAHASLRVTASPAWSTIPTAQVGTQSSPPAAVAAASTDADRVAYCNVTAISVTSDGGRTWIAVPTAGVSSALTGGGYQQPAGAEPLELCATLALDPHLPTTIFAAFTVSAPEPPGEALVAVVTNNNGAAWRLITPPHGIARSGFSKFDSDATGVDADYAPPATSAPTALPPTTGTPLLKRIRTVDGGRNWTAALSCSVNRPCVTLTPSATPCNPVGFAYELEYSLDQGKTWQAPTWPEPVSCQDHQLVELADGKVLLLDPSGYWG